MTKAAAVEKARMESELFIASEEAKNLKDEVAKLKGSVQEAQSRGGEVRVMVRMSY